MVADKPATLRTDLPSLTTSESARDYGTVKERDMHVHYLASMSSRLRRQQLITELPCVLQYICELDTVATQVVEQKWNAFRSLYTPKIPITPVQGGAIIVLEF